ncbi:uncharacterized protein LOC144873583 [Branchiostoma floridae x Branchiostoma japonicum]
MEGERRGNLELEGELVERGGHGDGVRRAIPLKLSSHHSKRTASVRDDRGSSSEKHHGPMKWDVKLNLIGKKINDTMLHLCEKCVCPVNLYGRMIPCKHVFCFDCSKRTDKNCLRCGDPVQRIEQCPRGAVFMCTFGDGKHGNKGCRRTYLSQRDLQAHINHRHKRPAVAAEPTPHQTYPTTYQPYPTSQDQSAAVYRPVPGDQYAPPPPPPPPQPVPQGMPMTHGAPLQPPPEHRDYSRMPPHHSIPPPGHPHDDRMHEPPPHPIPPPQHYQDPLTGHATTGPPHPDHLPPPPPPPPPEHHRYPPSSDSLPNPVSQSYMPVTSSRSSNLITVPIKDDSEDLAKQAPSSTQTPHNQGTMYRPIHQGAAPAVPHSGAVPIPYSAPPPHGHVGQPVHSGPPVVRGPGYDSHGRPYDESAISPPFAQPGGHSPRAAWPLAGPPPRGPAPVPQGPVPGGMPSVSSAPSSSMPPQAAHGHPPRTSYYN